MTSEAGGARAEAGTSRGIIQNSGDRGNPGPSRQPLAVRRSPEQLPREQGSPGSSRRPASRTSKAPSESLFQAQQAPPRPIIPARPSEAEGADAQAGPSRPRAGSPTPTTAQSELRDYLMRLRRQRWKERIEIDKRIREAEKVLGWA